QAAAVPQAAHDGLVLLPRDAPDDVAHELPDFLLLLRGQGGHHRGHHGPVPLALLGFLLGAVALPFCFVPGLLCFPRVAAPIVFRVIHVSVFTIPAVSRALRLRGSFAATPLRANGGGGVCPRPRRLAFRFSGILPV